MSDPTPKRKLMLPAGDPAAVDEHDDAASAPPAQKVSAAVEAFTGRAFSSRWGASVPTVGTEAYNRMLQQGKEQMRILGELSESSYESDSSDEAKDFLEIVRDELSVWQASGAKHREYMHPNLILCDEQARLE